eukprot:403364626
MNKILVLAAFLGYATCGVFDFWTTGAPSSMGYIADQRSFVSGDWFSVSHFAEFDAGFGTLYQGKDIQTSAMTRIESYGVHLYSYGRESVQTMIGKYYNMNMDVQFEPVYIAPYIQTISWIRPTEGFSLAISGSRYADAFAYQTFANENMQVFQHSLVDFIQNESDLLPTSGSMAPNSEYEHEWSDARFTGNLLSKLSASTYADLQNNLLGSHDYYSKIIV